MADGRAIGLSDLAKYGFVELSGTVSKLDELVGLVGDAGRSTLASLAKTANPDQALTLLLGFAESDSKRIRKLLGRSDSADRVCLVLGASSALADFLRRTPEAWSVFEKPITKLDGQDVLTASIHSAVAKNLEPLDLAEAWNTLRRAYRLELLKIAIFDLSQEDAQSAFASVSAALADLAGAALDVALMIARAELEQTKEHGVFAKTELENTRLAVMAMGKCGARELNYISDVDVIFVADPASTDLTVERCLEVATRLATRMMRAIDGTSSEPALWQVDPNLRPEGKSGALVRTLDSHLAYYERWAESWEFQALLKARPLAGDRQLGESYVAAMASKIWTASTRDGFVESAQKMRQRVIDNIPANELDRQIKLGHGGLRDVEFTVQLLQLVHGRQDETVRARDTLAALEALAGAGYIGRPEAQLFASHYRFLRTIEHRIQLSQLRRTHLIPTSETELRALARSVSVRWSAESFNERLAVVRLEVKSLHQRLFYRPLLSAAARLSDSALELTTEQAEDRLRAIGFVDARGALTHIQALTSGLSRRAAIQKTLLPVLIEYFAQGPDPDSGLLAFRRLSEDLGESHWYLRMLRDSSGAAEKLTRVLSSSKLVTALFEKIPEAAAWFDDEDELQPIGLNDLKAEIQAITDRHDSADAVATALRHLRRRETLRLAMGAVLGNLTITEVSRGLSDITEAYLVGLLKCVQQFAGLELSSTEIDELLDFAIVAMGRFGGQELGFGSDADLIYVYETKGEHSAEDAQRVAERIVSEIKRLSRDSILEFEIDLDLRPEGKNGPVVRSLASYAAYYKRWSDTWESQALLRARVIAGSSDLTNAFTELIDKHRYPKDFSAKALTEIRRIKARVETERLPQGVDRKRHLKLGPGSLSDVEWLVQIMQLQFGSKHPDIQSPKTLDSLQQCVRHGIIAEHDARVLAEAWTFASRVRSAIVLAANKRLDVLPTDRRQLEGIARILEYPTFSASVLEEDYLAVTRRARRVFDRLFYGQVNDQSAYE